MRLYVLTVRRLTICPFFFFNDTATTEIYTLSLHDALPIFGTHLKRSLRLRGDRRPYLLGRADRNRALGDHRSEEHTSELQSQSNLVCRLLLEKKKIYNPPYFGSMTRFRHTSILHASLTSSC